MTMTSYGRIGRTSFGRIGRCPSDRSQRRAPSRRTRLRATAGPARQDEQERAQDASTGAPFGPAGRTIWNPIEAGRGYQTAGDPTGSTTAPSHEPFSTELFSTPPSRAG